MQKESHIEDTFQQNIFKTFYLIYYQKSDQKSDAFMQNLNQCFFDIYILARNSLQNYILLCLHHYQKNA